MTSPSDKDLRERLNTSVVAERDEAFTASLLGKVRRDRRRGVYAGFLWVAVLAALIGLLAAGFFMGGIQAARLALGAVSGA
jgi:hypothetical protein